VRRHEDIERVKRGGCEIVAVDDEEIGAVQTRLQGLNVRLALDVIGGSSAGRLLQLLSPKGKLVTYGGVSGKPMELPGSLLIWKQLTVEGFFEGPPAHCPKNRASITRAGQNDRARRHSPADDRNLSDRPSQRGGSARCQRRQDTSEPQRQLILHQHCEEDTHSLQSPRTAINFALARRWANFTNGKRPVGEAEGPNIRRTYYAEIRRKEASDIEWL
jgi:hypothetical protein